MSSQKRGAIKLKDLRKPELKVQLEIRGLDKAGDKPALRERLGKALEDAGKDPNGFVFELGTESPKRPTPTAVNTKKTTPNIATEGTTTMSSQKRDGKTLKDLRKPELKVQLESRGLNPTGDKPALRERLGKALEAEGEDPTEFAFEPGTKKKTPISPVVHPSGRLALDIGGQIFVTSWETVSAVKDNTIAKCLSEGAHVMFFDRDPTHFRLILNYLRYGGICHKTILPVTRCELKELEIEAAFFNLPQLVSCCVEKYDAL